MAQYFFFGKIRVIVTSLFLLVSCTFVICQSTDPFAKNFKNPDDDYKPATWMHGMSGNMSKVGMTKDLEAIKKVGIGKVLLFNITQGIPHGPIKYASKDHFDIIQHAIAESDRLGLEFGTHNCDGWTSSGGPWVTPENSMKRVVWTKQIIDGGKSPIYLKQPTTIAGLYKDITVIAYPSLNSELEDIAVFPKLSSSDPTFPIENIFSDVESNEYHKLKYNNDKKAFINFDYPIKRNIRSVTLSMSDRNGEVTLEKSDDGINYVKVRDLLKVRLGKGEWAISDNFPAIQAKHFRLSFNSECNIRRVQFTSEHLLQNYLSAISMARTEADALHSGYAPTKGDIIDPQTILFFGTPNNDQTILLDLPKGMKWTVMRFGYTSTGAVNSPASNEGRGLEVDKLDKRALEIHFEKFIGKIADVANKNGNQSFKYSEIDSYEMGGQNWTNALGDELLKRKRFDILKYMPIFAGKYVESEKSTKAILNDLRDVISQLMVENYYGHFQTLCNERGLKSYVEPYGFGPFNFLDAAGKSDLTMGEFWMGRPIT
ncbi:MAG TPA: glycosyl hydrolase, partial [Saprospiraceae bacterium]|nr:glycosyl hydrolase [Saprospiraceae bacterium]